MKTFTVTRQVRFGGGENPVINHRYIIEASDGAQAARLADAMKVRDEKKTSTFKGDLG